MRESSIALAGALERDHGGLAVVLYPDFGLRDWIVEEVESLAPSDARTIRVRTVEEALQNPDMLALLVPDDEVEAVRDLDGSRDRALSPPRSQPIVLFLLRHGDGIRTMATEAPSMESWASGSNVDPEALAAVDITAERQSFREETTMSPEEWLVRWRNDEVPRVGANFALAYRAMLLEELPS